MTVIDSRQIKLKAISQLRYLLIGASLLSGWMAGNSIERYFIRVHAWRKIDLSHWAEFSRHEYLGYGFYFYLTEALGCFVLLLIALIMTLNNKFRFIKWHVLFAFIFSVLFIGMTCFIAPLMFQLKNPGNDPEAIRQVFEEVNNLGLYRGM